MPRLPRTPLYEVQNAQNNTRVTPIQRVSGEDAVGAALGKQGEAAFEIGSRLRDAQITNEVAKAHNDLNLKLDAEYRQLEKDTGDPLELEAKWQKRSKAIMAETSGGMTSPMHRRLFDAQAAQMAEGYRIKTRDLTRRKQVDGAIADSARQLDTLQYAFMASILFVAIPVLAEAMAGRLVPDDDDDETVAGLAGEAVISNFAGQFPVLRDFVNYRLKPEYGYNLSPVASGLTDVAQSTTVLDDGEITDAEARRMVRALGALLGIPSSQLVITGDYVLDVAAGEEDPMAEPERIITEGLVRNTDY